MLFLPDGLTFWGAVALLLQFVIVAAVTLRVMLTRHPPGASFAWILLTTILPYAGFVLYLLFGERPIGRIRARRLAHITERWQELGRHKLTPLRPLPRNLVRHSPLIQLATHVGGTPLTTGSKLELCPSAEATFGRLLEDFETAQKSIHLVFYIWNSSGLVTPLCEALVRARRRGVEIRILLDDFGSRDFLGSEDCRTLRDEGIQIAAAMPIKRLDMLGLQRIDLRLHRKLVVIDERIAYTGSLNMIDPYEYDAARWVGPWVDAMVRVEGPATSVLNAVWKFDWALQPDGDLSDLEQEFSSHDTPNEGEAAAVVIPTGPHTRGDQSVNLVIEAMNHAEHNLTIVTPYFVPNEAVVTALVNARLRGATVTLIIPHRTDAKPAAWAARRYFDDLLQAGVEILYYEGGLLHTKAITIDNEAALFGTLNIDNRSMHLMFELTMLVFDKSFMREIETLVSQYRTKCVALDPVRWRHRPFTERLKEGASYLVSPLL